MIGNFGRRPERLYSLSSTVRFSLASILHILFLAFFLFGCGRAGNLELAEDVEIVGGRIASGNSQHGFSGFKFPQPLKVRVSSGGSNLPGIQVRFYEETSTGVQILNPVSRTDMQGLVSTEIISSPYASNNIVVAADIEGYGIQRFNLTTQMGGYKIEYVQGNNQTEIVNTVLPTTPTIRVVDVLGDPVPDWNIEFRVTSGNGTIVTTQKTDSNGLATADWTMGTDSTVDQQLRFDGKTSASPRLYLFNADATPAPASDIQLLGATSKTAGDCESYVVNLIDQFGNFSPVDSNLTVNLTDGASGTWYSDASCTGGNEITSTTITTTNYKNTVYYRNTVSGNYTLTADDAGSINAGTVSLLINPDRADHLAIYSGNGQSAVVNTSVANNPTVKVEDQFGNGVPDIAVNFSVTSGNGSVVANATLSDSNGLVSAVWTMGKIVATNTLKALASTVFATPKEVTFTAQGLSAPAYYLEITGSNLNVAGECAGPYVVTTKDQYTNITDVTTDTVINLTSLSIAKAYPNSSCTNGTDVSSVTIPTSNSNVQFY